jgi:hypothetical protein
VTLIPDVILGEAPVSERTMFQIVKQAGLGDAWTVFHSLNCAEHDYKPWSEIDFLFMGPPGLFVLEVKGGRVVFQDGRWDHIDRFGRRHQKTEGPFKQAASAMYALKRELMEGREGEFLNDVVFGFGVVFVDVTWDVDTPEMPREIVMDAPAFRDPSGVQSYLHRLVDYWTAKHRRRVQLDRHQLNLLRDRIRPNVDKYPPFSVHLGAAMRSMHSLTVEQYRVLDGLERNERVVITGGAGTGKTFLLMQAARREVAKGRRVLVVVESHVLAAHLRRLESHSLLTIAAIDEVGRIEVPAAEVLLVDEGQDLLTLDVLALLGSRLEGDLDEGRWRWFMDENRQAGISGEYEEEARDQLFRFLKTGTPNLYDLTQNCRNAPEIVGAVEAWTAADLGEPRPELRSQAPMVVPVPNRSRLAEMVADRLEELLGEHVLPEEIAVVWPKGSDRLSIPALRPSMRRLCTLLDPATVGADLRGRILMGPVDRFKGLERPVVLAVGFDDPDLVSTRVAELYVATTRANFVLYVFAEEPMAEELEHRLQMRGTRPRSIPHA